MPEIGTFPKDWDGKWLLYFEPHSDDFLLNAYSLVRGIWMRGAQYAPAGLTVVTVSTSEANRENGLRGIMAKKHSMQFRQIELGFPDIVWDKATKDKFKAEKSHTFEEVEDQDILDWYNIRVLKRTNYFQLALQKIIETVGIAANNTLLVFSPTAPQSAHPFHRMVRCALENQGRMLWYYIDNPYCIKAGTDIPLVVDRTLTYNLSEIDRAKKFAMFCEHYSSQYTSQVLWNNAWMLHNDIERFYTTGFGARTREE